MSDYLDLSKHKFTFDIDIVHECVHGFHGLCHKEDKFVYIEIARNDRTGKLPLKQLLINIAHEMVHAKQYASGQLENNEHGWIYKGINYNNFPYEDRPWEIEANSMECKIYEECIKRAVR